MTRAVAAITPGSRSSFPRWAGTVGMVLGTGLGVAACYGLAALF
jgi:hypothetical protein